MVRVTIAKVVKIKAQRGSCLICITMQIVPGVRGLKPADWITVTLKNVKNLVCATCHTPCNVLLFTSCSISHLHSNANRFTGDDIQDRWLDNVTPKNVKNLVCTTCPTNDAVCCSLPEWRHLKPPDWIKSRLRRRERGLCQVLLFTSCVLVLVVSPYNIHRNLHVNELLIWVLT